MNNRLIVIIAFILNALVGYVTPAAAQYPFESHPSIHFKKFSKWLVTPQTNDQLDFSMTIPNFYPDHTALAIKIAGNPDHDSCIVSLSNLKGSTSSFIEPIQISLLGPEPQSAFLEDVNGDGLNDLKILIPNNACCGAYNFYVQVIYLFQHKDHSFTKISFQDLMWDYQNRVERKIDNNHNYEIITQTFRGYRKHNYLVYNLYNYNGRKLINVNYKANYPIMIQLLDDPNYKITSNLSRNDMKKFAMKLPDDYNEQVVR